MKRLTYQTAGDATRQAHYCAGYGVKKDDVVQRLGEYEDTGLTPEQVAELKERQSERRGKWEEINEYGGWGDTHYRCSVCGEEWYLEDGKPADNNMNFCPKCGARMDKLQGE